MPWHCHGNAMMALPWQCHGNAMAMPWHNTSKTYQNTSKRI
jgi:hypothetical protein